MPRLTTSSPKYRHHRASGQAFVELSGKRFYLGPHGTSASKREYDRLVGEWQQNGRRLPSSGRHNALSMSQLLNEYRKFARGYYVKNGQATDTIHGIRAMLKLVRKHYGHTLAADFGPLALKALQTHAVEEGASRRYVNDHTDRIKRMFKWAASNELLPFESYQRMTTVSGLAKGRTKARETRPIQPVSDRTIELTAEHLTSVVADMVGFQRLTGARPTEVCIIRPCDIETNSDVWIYRPESHKTEHHGKDRVIMIGPRAQDVLRPYLLRGKEDYCFSPAESERKRKEKMREGRKTKVQPCQRDRSKRNPKRTPGERYNKDSYRRAIHRACEKAFGMPIELRNIPKSLPENVQEVRKAAANKWRAANCWAPNQLRHSTGTDVRKKFGIEAAQVILGHSNLQTTQIYAEKDLAAAADVARQIG